MANTTNAYVIITTQHFVYYALFRARALTFPQPKFHLPAKLITGALYPAKAVNAFLLTESEHDKDSSISTYPADRRLCVDWRLPFHRFGRPQGLDRLVLYAAHGFEAQQVFDRVMRYANDLGLFAEEYDVAADEMLGNKV